MLILIILNQIIHMEAYNPAELLGDRIKFKFHAAEKQLEKLKEYNKTETMGETSEIRVRWEIEIECLLNHLIGAKDALLARINDKLNLNLPDEDVKLNMINSELTKIGKSQLLQELNNLSSDPNNWYWKLNKARNRGTHGPIFNLQMSRSINENVNTGTTTTSSSDSFLFDPRDIVSYLQDSIEDMKKLIGNIMNQEPKLSV